MAYTHVTDEERTHIHAWRQEGRGRREIAHRLRRAPSTISRELRRNRGARGYRPKQAARLAGERERRPGPRRYTEQMHAEVDARLRAGHTPEMITGRVRLEGGTMVCKESIYKRVYADAKHGCDLWRHLPRAHRRRRRRCPRADRRGRLRNQRSIEQRPAVVEERSRPGDWEGDLVAGAPNTGHLVTLVDRSTRFTLVDYSASKGSDQVGRVICRLLRKQPAHATHTLTLDNGKEFARHEQVASACGIDVFFARPYHAWERGSNENVNGLLRRLYPKGTSFADMREDELELLDTYLNDRPRKCLGWQTPRERLHQQTNRISKN